jgi:hypothetical protein
LMAVHLIQRPAEADKDRIVCERRPQVFSQGWQYSTGAGIFRD